MGESREEHWARMLAECAAFTEANGRFPVASDGPVGKWLARQRTGISVTPERSIRLTTVLGNWQGIELSAWLATVGVERSGHGVYGVTLRDEESIMCYECGKLFKSLVSHLTFTHGQTAKSYREAHGLARTTPLTSLQLSEQMRERQLSKFAADPKVAKRFIADGSPKKRKKRSDFGKSPAGHVATVSASSARRTITYPTQCKECGVGLDPGLLKAKKAVCSEACRFASRSRAARYKAARSAGEPLDFEFRSGVGKKLLMEDVERITGCKRWTWEARLRNRIAPPHDGRVDGAKFWWESTIAGMEPVIQGARGSYLYQPNPELRRVVGE